MEKQYEIFSGMQYEKRIWLVYNVQKPIDNRLRIGNPYWRWPINGSDQQFHYQIRESKWTIKADNNEWYEFYLISGLQNSSYKPYECGQLLKQTKPVEIRVPKNVCRPKFISFGGGLTLGWPPVHALLTFFFIIPLDQSTMLNNMFKIFAKINK